MRSRFTAFVLRDAGYLLRTWHSSTRPHDLDLAGGPRFTRLEVLGSTGGTLFDTEATVRFRAHYTDHGRPGALAENSRFVREAGHWFYVGPISSAS